jgi:hypothetical protein
MQQKRRKTLAHDCCLPMRCVLRHRRAKSPLAGIFVFALWWGFTAAAGCGGEPRQTPKAALKAFIAAVERGDRKAVWKRLGPRTRKKLRRWADTATQKMGGQVDLKPVDLISSGARVGAISDWEPKKIKIIKKTAKRATFAVSAQAPPHTQVTADSVAVTWIAGSARQIRTKPEPRWSSAIRLPILGLTVVGFRFPPQHAATIKAGHRSLIHMVRHNGRWCAELEL